MYGKFILNADLLALAAALGQRYDARVILWGVENESEYDELERCDSVWHHWDKGANAIDLQPNDLDLLPMMQDDARNAGYKAEIKNGEYLHIEVPW